MKFGIFDHVDRSDLPLNQILEKRIEYVKSIEANGFYSYHVAEHHATPLNLVPVPGVYRPLEQVPHKDLIRVISHRAVF